MTLSNPPADLSEVKITDRFNLTGRNYVITGGGRGIGLACAKAIAQLGGGIAVIDMASEPEAEFNTLSERFGVKTCYAQGDVTNQVSLEKAFEQVVQTMGQLHGGLTCAGIVMDTPLLDAQWDVVQKVFNVNVMGTYWLIKLLAQHLISTKVPGSIVTVASINAQGIYVPVQPKSAYNASKAAIKGLMGPLAGELGPHGIRINCISPSATETPLLARFEGEKKKIIDWHRDGAPLGRLAKPEDLTPMVCYLLSDAAAYTTGADMLVTGGLHAGSKFSTGAQ